jgi:hypothetical protein
LRRDVFSGSARGALSAISCALGALAVALEMANRIRETRHRFMHSKNRNPRLQLLKSQLGTVMQIYGPASGVELIPSLHWRVYITKHDYHPVTWEMYF